VSPRVSPAAIHIQPFGGCFFNYLKKLSGIRFSWKSTLNPVQIPLNFCPGTYFWKKSIKHSNFAPTLVPAYPQFLLLASFGSAKVNRRQEIARQKDGTLLSCQSNPLVTF
jgi:hypothetical protein